MTGRGELYLLLRRCRRVDLLARSTVVPIARCACGLDEQLPSVDLHEPGDVPRVLNEVVEPFDDRGVPTNEDIDVLADTVPALRSPDIRSSYGHLDSA